MEGSLTPRVVGFLCRTSDREGFRGEGAQAAAEAIALELGVRPRLIGAPGEPRVTTYDQDLVDSRGCLMEAGGQIDDALHDGDFPILTSGACSVCVTTLGAVARHRPNAFVLWLDAHADFNTPDTTPSQFLGGMCLAGACGVWDTGFGAAIDPSRVVMCGVRDVDPGEQELLDTLHVSRIDKPSRLADALAGREVFIHLDADVLDPSVIDGLAYPAPGGFGAEGLTRLLAGVAATAQVVGIEVAGCPSPRAAEILAPAVAAAVAFRAS